VQSELVERFNDLESPLFGRVIYWFWETKGGYGKTTVCKYFVDQMGAILLGGACKDCLYGFAQYIEEHGEAPDIVIFDIPRVNKGAISYQAIEAIKNGMIFSPKYESGMKRFNSPHVIVFSNDEPEYESFTDNRWRVECLCPAELDLSSDSSE
jgi:hypothetical protein